MKVLVSRDPRATVAMLYILDKLLAKSRSQYHSLGGACSIFNFANDISFSFSSHFACLYISNKIFLSSNDNFVIDINLGAVQILNNEESINFLTNLYLMTCP